jgi:hypothetical protein
MTNKKEVYEETLIAFVRKGNVTAAVVIVTTAEKSASKR